MAPDNRREANAGPVSPPFHVESHLRETINVHIDRATDEIARIRELASALEMRVDELLREKIRSIGRIKVLELKVAELQEIIVMRRKA
jgi:hypothetical protein